MNLEIKLGEVLSERIAETLYSLAFNKNTPEKIINEVIKKHELFIEFHSANIFKLKYKKHADNYLFVISFEGKENERSVTITSKIKK